jgi:hypothetical protein
MERLTAKKLAITSALEIMPALWPLWKEAPLPMPV